MSAYDQIRLLGQGRRTEEERNFTLDSSPWPESEEQMDPRDVARLDEQNKVSIRVTTRHDRVVEHADDTHTHVIELADATYHSGQVTQGCTGVSERAGCGSRRERHQWLERPRIDFREP